MNQIKAGAILNYVIIGLNTLVGLAYTPYMLRCLGQSEYGLYSLVASIIAYLTILDFGFGNAIVRYTAKFRAQGNTHDQWNMFGMFMCVYCIIGVVAFLIGLGLFFNVESLFDKTMTIGEIAQARVMILLLSINLAVTFPFSMFGSIITAYEDFIFQKVVSIIRLLLSTVTIVVLLYFGYKAVAMVVVQTVFNISTLFLNFLYCYYKLRIKIRFSRFDISFVKEITIYSFWLFLNAIIDRIFWGTGQFVLGAISGTIAVSIFSLAILLQQMYLSFSTAISGVLLPKITKIISSNDDSGEISEIFVRTGRIQCGVLALTLSGFIVFGRGFIYIWAGEGYVESYWVALLFFIALFIPLIQNTGVVILQARNQMKFRTILYCVISLASLVLQIFLSKRYGALGCAFAISVALLIGHGFVMNVYYKRIQHIDINKFWREIINMLTGPCLLTIVGLISTIFFNFSNPLILFAGIALYVVLFCSLFWIKSMNEYERNLVRVPFCMILKKINKE